MIAPKELRDRVARDLRAVRPLRPPLVRSLVLIPIAVAIRSTHFSAVDQLRTTAAGAAAESSVLPADIGRGIRTR